MAVSLRSSLLAAFLAPTLLVLIVASAAGYSFTRTVLEESLGESLSGLAAAAASQVNGERMLTIEAEDDVNQTRTWRNLVSNLNQVREAAGLRRVYAVDRSGSVRGDTGSLRQGGTTGAVPVGVELPELARDRLELERVFAGSRTASQVLFEGTDGQLYKTGFAPIYWGEEIVGAVGVEGTAAFFQPLQRLARGAALLGSLALLFTCLVAIVTARALAHPLRRLMGSALRIGRGDLQTPVDPEPTEEIGVLARELEAMRRALDSRDRQLKMMLAGVAHEVKNPLGGIELFGGLLDEELVDAQKATAPGALDEARSHLGRIRDEVVYLRHIVDDFLSFAREHRLQTVPTDAERLATAARSHVEAEANQKHVTVRIAAPGCELEVDPSLVTAALVNLTKNAVQAAPEGGTVTLRGEPLSDAYVLHVEDDGPGIPVELQERIFEAFYTTRQKGTGLGLALARKIAEAHGGALTLESRPGHTRFSLRLPRRSVGGRRIEEALETGS